jgi:Na+-driven multidrug efflux pump
MLPGLWATGQFDSSRRFLCSQYKNSIPVVTQIITTFLHLLWCYIFILKLEMREVGAAIALNITYILNMVITDAIIRYQKDTEFKDMVFFYDETVF